MSKKPIASPKPLISMKKLYLFILLLSSFTAHGGEWLADISKQCQVWNPDETANLTVRWTGDCKDGADGKQVNIQPLPDESSKP
jgi:hypothetical protein